MQLPPNSCCPVGLVYLELMHEQTHLLGGQKGAPLMLLPSVAAAEEACSLLLGSSSAAPDAIRAAASSPSSSPFLLDLGCWLEAVWATSNHTPLPFPTTNHAAPLTSSNTILTAAPAPVTRLLGMGLQLLCHSIRHCLPGCATAIMDIISTRLGITSEELLHSVTMPEVVPPSLSLLHLAVRGGDLPLIHSLLTWAELHSVRPDWTVAVPSGICPLHLAALLPNAETVVRGMLELPRPYGPDIAAAWLLCHSSDGRTPAELGSSDGLPASLDNLAHDVLVRAAEEEEASYATNLGSGAKSVSSASGASGIAAMMECQLTGEVGVSASGTASLVADGEGFSGGKLMEEEESAVGSGEAAEGDRELWKMPAKASAGKGLYAAGDDSEGRMGCRSGSIVAATSLLESPGLLSRMKGPPLTSLSDATRTSLVTASTMYCLCRLLLLGFPDRSVERRYSQFKVSS